jgi:hypothetical protein
MQYCGEMKKVCVSVIAVLVLLSSFTGIVYGQPLFPKTVSHSVMNDLCVDAVNTMNHCPDLNDKSPWNGHGISGRLACDNCESTVSCSSPVVLLPLQLVWDELMLPDQVSASDLQHYLSICLAKPTPPPQLS